MNTNTLFAEDIQLVLAYQNEGNNYAFGLLYAKYFSNIYEYINQKVRSYDIAIDLCQDTFTLAAENIQKLHNPIAFKKWLFRIASTNVSLYFRKHKLTRALFIDMAETDIIDDNVDLNDKMVIESKYQMMKKLTTELNYEESQLIYEKYYQELTIKDISVKHALSESAVKMKIYRAKHKMNLALQRSM